MKPTSPNFVIGLLTLWLAGAACGLASQAELTRIREALLRQARELNAEFAAFNKKYDGRELPPAEAAQASAERARFDERQARFVQAADGYFREDITYLDEAITNDLAAMRRLKLAKRAEEFEEWERLSTDARADLENQALDALISLGMTGAQRAATVVGSQNPWKAREMVARLKRTGVDEPYLLEAIGAVGAAKGKPGMAKAVNQWLEALAKAKDTYSVAKEGAKAREPKEKLNAALAALATVMAWGVEDPKLSMLVTELQLTTAAAYNNVARRIAADRIEQLTRLTEQELKSLKALDQRLKDHVQRRRQTREALETGDLAAKMKLLAPPARPAVPDSR